jgi:hypothetical protein
VSGIPTGYAPGEVYTTGAATGVAFGKLLDRGTPSAIGSPMARTNILRARRSVRFVTYTPAFQAACCTMAEMLASVYDCDAGGVVAGGRPTELSTSRLVHDQRRLAGRLSLCESAYGGGVVS